MRSAKASAIATSLTLGSAFKAWPAAPVPRPPQPIRPMRMTSLPAAWTWGSEASAAPAVVKADALRNSRREFLATRDCDAGLLTESPPYYGYRPGVSGPERRLGVPLGVGVRTPSPA